MVESACHPSYTGSIKPYSKAQGPKLKSQYQKKKKKRKRKRKKKFHHLLVGIRKRWDNSRPSSPSLPILLGKLK
jgi:hypothetical protein